MPTPRADTYSAASGAGIYAGMAAPVVYPTWHQALSVGTWGSISGTSGPGAGLNTNAYSGFAIKNSELLAVATGGHGDSSSNAAASIELNTNSPAWTTRRASTWNGTEQNVAYYADGSPCSRHTYHHNHYIPSLDAVVLAGCRYAYGGANTFSGVDLFSLSSNTYLARYTMPDLPAGAGYGVGQDGAGNIWTEAGYKLTIATSTWSRPGTGQLGRYPVAYDSIRDRLFCLIWNDGEGSGSSGLTCRDLNPSTGNANNITFNASSAWTQFQVDAPVYAGMAFCPLDGKFYFMHPGRIGSFYVVTPNAGTTWDMAFWTPGGSVPASSGALCRRLLWVSALNGFVLQSHQSSNLSFLRMA